MRKKLIAGNWKSNLAKSNAIQLAEAILEQGISVDFELVIFPPEIFIDSILEVVKSTVKVGAQNCSQYTEGAFTGETTALQLASAGVQMALAGHSERRHLFAETNEVVKLKIDKVLSAGLTPVFCCGEALETRKANEQNNWVEQQLEESLFHLTQADFSKVIIAYEPIWAIGTGVVATPKEAAEMHEFIRKKIAAKYDAATAESTRILYGGSVKADNAKALFSCPNIDGALVGGASLKANEFLAIANAAK
ncbi:MAG TPA: triose-phosphate isomerase [Chitinophagales bacterium]|nr:triose-phosphate isomerase [Chitinophagales bacterium]HRP38678.1 triose-phosphate isomerase [Chitinophagales bacterium]